MNVSMPNGLPSGQGAVTTQLAGAAQASAQANVTTAPQAASSTASAPQPTNDQIQAAVQNLRKAIAPVAQNLQFSVDNDTHQTVITVVDSSTREVIRQIPSEEVLAISKDLDKLQGLLLRNKA